VIPVRPREGSRNPPCSPSAREPPERELSLPQKKPWSSDEELVAEILGGSAEHFELLYQTYFPRVYRFAALMRELAYRNDGTFVGLSEFD